MYIYIYCVCLRKQGNLQLQNRANILNINAFTVSDVQQCEKLAGQEQIVITYCANGRKRLLWQGKFYSAVRRRQLGGPNNRWPESEGRSKRG
jgi:hypothetical protein